MRLRLDDRTAGLALVAGYSILLVVLYRNPVFGLENATTGMQSLLYFVAFPLAGLAVGGYALGGRRYSSALVFVAGSYLGVVGLTLALGGVASLPFVFLGVLLFALGAGTILVSVKGFVAFLGADLESFTIGQNN